MFLVILLMGNFESAETTPSALSVVSNNQSNPLGQMDSSDNRVTAQLNVANDYYYGGENSTDYYYDDFTTDGYNDTDEDVGDDNLYGKLKLIQDCVHRFLPYVRFCLSFGHVYTHYLSFKV